MQTGQRSQGRPSGRVLSALVTVAVVLLVAGCSPQETDPAPTGDGVEVFTWWASGSEKLGLDALVAVFAEQHPETPFIDGAIAGGAGSAAKDLLRSRLANDDPPDTFLVHGGAELTAHVEAGDLQSLEPLYEELELRDVLPSGLLELLTVDGTAYAVPSNVHRANVLWANPGVLREAGLDPSATYTSLDQWFVALEAVRATGRTPLAVASTWTQVHLLEQVLLARLGPEGYRGLFDGTTDPASPEVGGALADFERLLGYTNTDRDRLDWQDATQRVVGGQAAFTVMGDWAAVAFPGEVAWAPFPGTAGTYDLVLDAFTLPVDARRTESARKWLRTVASADAQAALSTAKGAIPPREDLGPEGFGAYQQAAMASFRTDELVPSLTHGSAAGPQVLDAVTTAVARFTSGTTAVTAFGSELAAALG